MVAVMGAAGSKGGGGVRWRGWAGHVRLRQLGVGGAFGKKISQVRTRHWVGSRVLYSAPTYPRKELKILKGLVIASTTAICQLLMLTDERFDIYKNTKV